MNRKLSLQPQPDVYLIHRLLFRLLPVQILLAAVSQINTIVSSLFASNYIGAQAMSAVGLYTPIGLLIGAVSVLFVSGSQIICGKFLGNNQVEQNSRLFSVSMLGTGVFSVITMLFLLVYTLAGFPGRGSGDAETRRLLNLYIFGQIPGVLPLLWGQQLSAFLSLENRAWRSTMASLASVAATVAMNFLLVAGISALLIRFKDDCRPFDPQERQIMMTPEDPAKNIGLRIVFRIAKEHSYQNLLGLNVLTLKL